MAQDNSKIYIGNIVTAENKEDRLINREALVIKDDKIVARGEPERILSQYDGELIRLTDNQILAPGYVDAWVDSKIDVIYIWSLVDESNTVGWLNKVVYNSLTLKNLVIWHTFTWRSHVLN